MIERVFKKFRNNSGQKVAVSLYEIERRYGGPEEGGWWYDDYTVIESVWFPDYETAEAAQLKMESEAVELTKQAKRLYSLSCQAQVDWLESRGLESHPYETDPEYRYEIFVEHELGERETHGRPHYE